jgi:oligoendopeptidase F
MGALDIDALVAASALARDYEYQLRQGAVQAEHLMTPAEEALQSDLSLSGGMAWSTMYGEVTSQITVPFELDGEMADRPITEIRNLASNADRSVRQRAHEAELAAWRKVGNTDRRGPQRHQGDITRPSPVAGAGTRCLTKHCSRTRLIGPRSMR